MSAVVSSKGVSVVFTPLQVQAAGRFHKKSSSFRAYLFAKNLSWANDYLFIATETELINGSFIA